MTANFCPHCGSQLKPGAKFCEACGKAIEATAAPRPAHSAEASAAPAPRPALNGGGATHAAKKKKRPLVWVLAAVAGLAVIGAIGVKVYHAKKLARAQEHYDMAMIYAKPPVRYSLVIEELSKAIELNPDFAEAYFVRAGAYEDTKEPLKAMSDYCQAGYKYTWKKGDNKKLLEEERRRNKYLCKELFESAIVNILGLSLAEMDKKNEGETEEIKEKIDDNLDSVIEKCTQALDYADDQFTKNIAYTVRSLAYAQKGDYANYRADKENAKNAK